LSAALVHPPAPLIRLSFRLSAALTHPSAALTRSSAALFRLSAALTRSSAALILPPAVLIRSSAALFRLSATLDRSPVATWSHVGPIHYMLDHTHYKYTDLSTHVVPTKENE
jgi:hypothetical protein